MSFDSQDNVIIGFRAGNGNGLKIQKYNSTGALLSTYGRIAGTGNQVAYSYDSVVDSNDNLYVAGSYANSVSFTGGTSFNCQGCSAGYIAKFDANLTLIWVVESKSSSSSSSITGIDLIFDDQIYVVGDFYATLNFGNSSISAGGNLNSFAAKINDIGEWQWGIHFDCSCTLGVYGLDLDSQSNMYIVGGQGGTIEIPGATPLYPAGGGTDAFVVKLDRLGNFEWGKSIGSASYDDRFNSVDFDDANQELYASGFFEGILDFGQFSKTSVGGKDGFIVKLSPDYDGDLVTDNRDDDDDDDFIVDILDNCHFSPLGFRSTGSSDHDSDGCHDDLEDEDDDNDQLNDTLDSCPKGMTGWIRTNASDLDDDGCMDALEDYDDDNDGFEDYEDYCSRIPGNSTFEFEKGCPDADGDGRPDILDPFKNDPTEWLDTDGDGVGDNSDAFPTDATQQYDTDGDTYGDEEFGNAGDSCPTVYGTSTIDRYGCLDTDGDGWSDEGDDFPDDPTEHLDTDGDEVPDHADDFPFDPTQQTDTDGDGYGDNANGNLGDAFPNDSQNMLILTVME